MNKFFDLHIEIGEMPNGHVYAKTVLGPNQIEFADVGLSAGEAIQKLSFVLETNNIFQALVQDPQLSYFPFTSVPAVAVQVKTDPNLPKKLPQDLIGVNHPDCQAQCTSFDHFKDAKCKNMCGQRNI